MPDKGRGRGDECARPRTGFSPLSVHNILPAVELKDHAVFLHTSARDASFFSCIISLHVSYSLMPFMGSVSLARLLF